MQWFWNAYLPDVAARQQITATPLNASLEQLKGLPDALVIVDENDVLRDEGGLCAQALTGRRAGHVRPLQRHDPRFRPAQRAHGHAGRARRAPAGQ
jgi:acetyl esterase/lipase